MRHARIGHIVHRYLASGRCDGVLAHHRERVRKTVATFFSTGHSLDTLVAQLVDPSVYSFGHYEIWKRSHGITVLLRRW